MPSCARCTRCRAKDGDCTDSCHHPDRAAGVLCARCLADGRKALSMIEATWRLSQVLGPVQISAGLARSSRGDAHRAPVDLDWLDWVDGPELPAALSAAVEEYTDLAAERDITLPRCRRSVPWLVLWLRTHLETVIAQHEACTDTIDEWVELAARGRRKVGDVDDGQIIVCPGDVDPCGQRLRIDVLGPDSSVRCWRCGVTWDADRLLWRARHGDVDAWFTAQDVFELKGIPPRTLRHWGQTGTVRRMAGRYHWGDVNAAAREAADVG